MGQNMGQSCGLATSQPYRQPLPLNLDLRHIRSHLGFTFSQFALHRFQRRFLDLCLGTASSENTYFLSSVNLPHKSNMGQKYGSGNFLSFKRRLFSPLRGLVIVPYIFQIASLFFPQKYHRQTASPDTAWRRLTKRIEQIYATLAGQGTTVSFII